MFTVVGSSACSRRFLQEPALLLKRRHSPVSAEGNSAGVTSGFPPLTEAQRPQAGGVSVVWALVLGSFKGCMGTWVLTGAGCSPRPSLLSVPHHPLRLRAACDAADRGQQVC